MRITRDKPETPVKVQRLNLTHRLVLPGGNYEITSIRSRGGLMMEGYVDLELRDSFGNRLNMTYDWGTKVEVR